MSDRFCPSLVAVRIFGSAVLRTPAYASAVLEERIPFLFPNHDSLYWYVFVDLIWGYGVSILIERYGHIHHGSIDLLCRTEFPPIGIYYSTHE